MRALMLAPWLGAGGAERQLALLATGLRARGHDVRVVGLNTGGHRVTEMEAAGVAVEVLGMRGPLDLRPALRSRLLRGEAPDVVLSAGVNGLYIGALVARARGARHFYNEHRGVGVELSARRRAMMAVLARSLTGVIVVSADQRPEWISRGVAPDRVHTVPNGVAAEPPTGRGPALREELGLGPDAVLALCVASLKPLKRVGDFVAAVTRARETVSDLVGLVAGEGPDRATLEAQAAGTGAVRFLGLREDVPRLLEAADVLVLASEREALPMAVLEAMASGVPPIATRVGAVPDVVADGVSGILVEPGDVDALAVALTRLAADPALRARLGAAARIRARSGWSVETMVDRYERLLATDAPAARP